MLAMSGIALASCNTEVKKRDNFDYTQKNDKFSGTITSVAESKFPVDPNKGAFIWLSAKCIHSTAYGGSDKFTFSASSGDDNNFGNRPYVNALIYKIDDSAPIVYHDPQPIVHSASEYPDTVAGRWQTEGDNAMESSKIPTSNDSTIHIDMMSIIEQSKRRANIMTLRFVYGAPAYEAFGSQTVQYYSQYSSKDVEIKIGATNFGRVLSDCGINQ